MARPQKGLLRGKKFNSRHSTVIENAVPILNAAKKLAEVHKIVLGVIRSLRPAEPHLRFSPVPSGLKVQVRGRTAVQIFYVYTNDPAHTERILTEEWDKL